MENHAMKIDCYLSVDCPSEEALRRNIGEALKLEKANVSVSFHHIGNEEALSLGITGSPTVFVNGREIQPQGKASFS
jgi:hypothetical protein